MARRGFDHDLMKAAVEVSIDMRSEANCVHRLGGHRAPDAREHARGAGR